MFNSRNRVGEFSLGRCVRSKLKKFRRDEDGAVTVEFVLWVPVFVLILVVTTDATIMLTSQASVWSIARDTTRFMSTGLYSNSEAEAYVASRLPSWGQYADISASRTANTATINVSVPMSKVAPFNISSGFSSGNLVVGLSQHIEPR